MNHLLSRADIIIMLVVGLAFSMVSFRYIYRMLKSAEFTELNFRNERIPIGMGILFITLAPILSTLIYVYTGELRAELLVVSMGILIMGFAGLIDDFLGNKNDKGFKGHIKALLKGRLTTGGFKALLGFIMALAISAYLNSGSLVNIVLNTFLIALFTNIINLFDLRPGRACKAYIFFLIIISAASNRTDILSLAALYLGIVLGYIRKDLKAKVMLGDVGSNALGASLGVLAAISCGFEARLAMTGVLILLHLISEFYSFTKIIEKVSVFKFIDELGRK